MVPSPAMKQPEDILQVIFRELYPPLSIPLPEQSSYFHKSVIHHTPARVLSVISICRSWYSAGLRTLYQDILITRIDQIPALLRSLNNTGTSSKCWVQSIGIHAVFPQDQDTFENSFVHPFTQLLHLCPNLKTLTFTTNSDINSGINSVEKYPRSEIPFRFRCPIVTAPCNLTHFYVNSVDHYAGLFDALVHMSHTLISFGIEDIDPDDNLLVAQYPDRFATSGTLTFARLHTLSVSTSVNVLKKILTWEIPNLERLILSKKDGFYQRSGRFREQYTVVKHFFSKFGIGVKVLDIYPTTWSLQQRRSTLPYVWYAELLGWVPALEHLIVHHSQGEKWRAPVQNTYLHTNVKWIDICEEDQTNEPNSGTLEHIYNTLGYFIHHTPHDSQADNPPFEPPIIRFPSLLGIRVFPQSVCHWNNLPHNLLPWPTEGPEKVEYYPSSDFEPGPWGPRKYEPIHDDEEL